MMNTAVGDTSHKFDNRKRLSSGNYYKYIKAILLLCQFWVMHYQHFGRHYGPAILEMGGCEERSIKNLGGWERAVYEKHYTAGLPMEALRIAAGHSKEIGTHWVPRSTILPPPNLAKQTFP